METILIADDEVHILNVLAWKLRNAGYQVVTAADGHEALELAKSKQPDLLITDYQMPLLSGLELCTRMHADPTTCDIPAILLTARGYDLPVTGATDTNIKGVAAKPFSPQNVVELVQDVLRAVQVASTT